VRLDRAVRKLRRGARSEEGGSLVEMALVSAFLLFPALFGIIEFSYGLYTYNWVNMVSRQATRYAVVRGAPSCEIQSGFQNCDLGPDSTNNAATATALQNYVAAYAYPGIYTDSTHLTVTTTWLSPTVTSGTGGFSNTTWTTPCTTSAANTPKCNTPGYAVQVNVVYNFGVSIPFWRKITVPMNATSQMVINE
jgi:Flp pilus assembly protein TadG